MEWHSPEHHFNRKSNDWYWGLGIIATGSIILAVYFDNVLFGIFIAIAAITIGILSYKETQVVPIRVVPKGIIFDRHLFPFKSYRSFWIEPEHLHGTRILLHPTNNFLPLSIIPVNDEIDPVELRDLLLEFLNEEYLEESIVHKWFDKLIAR